jgi:hypothetical protein
LAKVTDGSSNTAIGTQCCNEMSTGHNNTCIGAVSGFGITSGVLNCIMGSNAENNDNPSQCVAIGANTNVGDFTNSIAIGFQASCFNNNQVVIGNGAIAQTILKGTVNCQDLGVVAIDAITANFTTSMTTPTAIIDGASLSVANNTLTATINNIPYPIVGRDLSRIFNLTQDTGLHNIGGEGVAIQWITADKQLQYINISDEPHSYSFTMSYYNSTGIKRIIGSSTYAGWRYFTPTGSSFDPDFTTTGSSGRIEFTLISENDSTKPSYIGSIVHGSSTGVFKLEVINS